MPVRVVDASAIAAVLFDEPTADAIEARLQGASLVAPSLLPYELANVCLKKTLQRPEEADALRRALARFSRLGVRSRTVSASSMAALASETKLTVYDASYLWVALEIGVPLVTLDRRLDAVAGALLG